MSRDSGRFDNSTTPELNEDYDTLIKNLIGNIQVKLLVCRGTSLILLYEPKIACPLKASPDI